jgi:nucleoside-diphosphate-sugar epimerase
MTRTLLTGAAGFTGQYVARALAERGHEIHALVHEVPPEQLEGVAFLHEADLADFDAVSRVVELVRPDHVVHLAAIAFVGHDDLEQMYRSNVVGSRQLLEALDRASSRPGTVVLASSANVYGNAREGAQDESAPLAPANDYAVSKVAMEYVASLYRSRLPLILVRPFNYTGRGQSTQFVVPKIVAHARERAPFIELGNLDVARDFSDVRMVAEAYARLVSTPEAIGATYNICSGKALALGEVIELVSQLSGHRLEVKVNPALVRDKEVAKLWGSAAKLEGAIGPLPSIPFEETLRWMLES